MSETKRPILPIVSASAIRQVRRDPLDEKTIQQTREILQAVQTGGDLALRQYGQTFGDIETDQPLLLDSAVLAETAAAIPVEQRELLGRVADRIRQFAQRQLECLAPLDTPVPSGTAGHRLIPLASAGCYAPGGRFPLPSSVLMTVIPARVAGVNRVVVASPRPAPITLAAAAVAGADAVLAVGGAQAIAALAYGTESVSPVDVVVGPGNRWVSAAKMLVAGTVNIDMVAGPSELVVVADESADPTDIALDLLAQAEHDVDALPVLISDSVKLIEQTRRELARLLAETSTPTAEESIRAGFAVAVDQLAETVGIVNELAPEHLQVMVADPDPLVERFTNYGGLFIGRYSAEVFGDYGVGPNHVLPTSGAARRSAGLSVTTFLRQPTYMRLSQSGALEEIVSDTAALAELEGLVWHARAARSRGNEEQSN